VKRLGLSILLGSVVIGPGCAERVLVPALEIEGLRYCTRVVNAYVYPEGENRTWLLENDVTPYACLCISEEDFYAYVYEDDPDGLAEQANEVAFDKCWELAAEQGYGDPDKNDCDETFETGVWGELLAGDWTEQIPPPPCSDPNPESDGCGQ
jgi:hypothetical protein